VESGGSDDRKQLHRRPLNLLKVCESPPLSSELTPGSPGTCDEFNISNLCAFSGTIFRRDAHEKDIASRSSPAVKKNLQLGKWPSNPETDASPGKNHSGPSRAQKGRGASDRRRETAGGRRRRDPKPISLRWNYLLSSPWRAFLDPERWNAEGKQLPAGRDFEREISGRDPAPAIRAKRSNRPHDRARGDLPGTRSANHRRAQCLQSGPDQPVA